MFIIFAVSESKAGRLEGKQGKGLKDGINRHSRTPFLHDLRRNLVHVDIKLNIFSFTIVSTTTYIQ